MKRLLFATIALLAACKPTDPPRSPGESMDYITEGQSGDSASVTSDSATP